MSRIFEGISAFMREHFDADDWETDEDGDRTLAFRLEDEEGRAWDCGVLIDDEEDRLVCYSTMLGPAKKSRRAEVMEFLTRANFALPVGNFELDLDDGEVCFKTSLDLEDVELTPAMCRNLVDNNLMVMGTYFDALTSVMKGEAEPGEAIASVEDVED